MEATIARLGALSGDQQAATFGGTAARFYGVRA
jgi:hypothetical protein